jgi:hypothetical protein
MTSEIRFRAFALLGPLLALPATAYAHSAPYCKPAISCVSSTGADYSTPNVVRNDTGAGMGNNHPEIVPIFWGTDWQSQQTLRGQWIGALQYMCNSSYFARLSQYGVDDNGMGPVRMVPMAPIDPDAIVLHTISSTVTDVTHDEVGAEIDALIARGAVGPPTAHANANVFYVVFIAPGYGNGSDWNDVHLGANGITYKMAIVHGGNLTSAGLPKTSNLAHELVEGLTYNITLPNCGPVGNPAAGDHQIADLCDCNGEVQGYGQIRLASYWSATDGACVVPDAWSGVFRFDGPMSWTQIGGPVREISAGGAGLFATDGNDNMIQFSGTPNQWNDLFGTFDFFPGFSMISAGDGDLLALSLHADQVWRFAGGAWTIADGNAAAAYSGGFDVDVDYDGNYRQRNVFTGSWSVIGGPADQIVVGGNSIAQLSLDHSDVLVFYPNAFGGRWVNTLQAAGELYPGPADSFAARELTSTGNITAYLSQSNVWNSLGAPANTIDVFTPASGQTTLVRLNNKRTAVFQDTAPLAATPSWLQIKDAATRLVSSGSQLFATVGIQILPSP